MFGIRDPRSGKNSSRISDPWGKKAPDPDPQHWFFTTASVMLVLKKQSRQPQIKQKFFYFDFISSQLCSSVLLSSTL
jgi:hypothetical protein